MKPTKASNTVAPPSAIVETCLDVSDLSRAREFYSRLFGYPIMKSDDRFCAFNVTPGQVFILFQRGSDPHSSGFAKIPPHDSSGQAHIGFSIPADSLASWQARLSEFGIKVESSFTWPAGGTSIYFRDPDGHLLELLTPGVWPSY